MADITSDWEREPPKHEFFRHPHETEVPSRAPRLPKERTFCSGERVTHDRLGRGSVVGSAPCDKAGRNRVEIAFAHGVRRLLHTDDPLLTHRRSKGDKRRKMQRPTRDVGRVVAGGRRERGWDLKRNPGGKRVSAMLW